MFEKIEAIISEDKTFDAVAKYSDKTKFSLLSDSRLDSASAVYTHAIHFQYRHIVHNEYGLGIHGLELSFEAFRGLEKMKVPHIGSIKKWDQFEELIRFVKSDENIKHIEKFDFINKQVKALNAPKNAIVYDRDALLQAFTWYNVSRSLYTKLRSQLQLPSLTTLKNITRVAKNKDDAALYTSFFASQEERAKHCILIVDEIYVKPSLTYRGEYL